MKIDGIDFNEDWARKASKEDFKKVHEHHADETDLDEAYEALQLPQEKTDDSEKPKSRKKASEQPSVEEL